MNNYCKYLFILLMLGLILLLIPERTIAIPAFARKYDLSCAACHTMYPKLNATGHEFRKLGYRFPYEVDQDMSVKKNQASTKAVMKPNTADSKKSSEKIDSRMSSQKSVIEAPPSDPTPAVQTQTGAADTSEISQLKQAILLLQKRVEELE